MSGLDDIQLDAAAAAILFAHQGKSWDCIPDVSRAQYRRMAQAAADALGLITEEQVHYPRSPIEPDETYRRLIGPWVRVGEQPEEQK